jgi:hypothetical protein
MTLIVVVEHVENRIVLVWAPPSSCQSGYQELVVQF